MDNRRYLPIIVVTAIIIIVLLTLSSSLFFKVKSGERAVIFNTLSGKLDKLNVIGPGYHMKAPWSDAYIYDVTENQIEETMDVLDKNGLNINVDITVRYHPVYDSIGEIYETFRQDYQSRLVRPEVRSTVRQVMGRYTAEEIYSTKRPEVEGAIRRKLRQY